MDKEQRIREIAYRTWEDEGRPEGQANRHWTLAEQRIDAQDNEPAQSPESDERAERMPVAIRTVRGKSGASASGADPGRQASGEAK